MKVQGRKPLTTRAGSDAFRSSKPSHFVHVAWNATSPTRRYQVSAGLSKFVQFKEVTQDGSPVSVFGLFSKAEADKFALAVENLTNHRAIATQRGFAVTGNISSSDE